MATYGLLTTGFVPKPLTVIRDEIDTSLRDAFGQSIALGDTSVLGQIAGILAELYSELWDLAEAVHKAGNDPDSATGSSLDAICALTGTLRRSATSSSVAQLVLAGTASAVIPSGTQASVTGTGDVFATTASVTLATVAAWAVSTDYSVGNFAVNGGNLYVCSQAGTSAGSGGPTGTGTTITDGTAVWYYVSTDAAAATVQADAVNTGVLAAATGDLNTITTPVSGWATVVNFTPATLGTDIETDENLRVRREAELAQAGSTTLKAIRAALLELSSVTTVTVFENNTDLTDADGVPPHAVEALVEGGTDQDIFDSLLTEVTAGIATHGTTTGTALDEQLVSHTMAFTRPTSVRTYVSVTLTYDATLYPSDGDTQIKNAIVAWALAQATGKDVVSSAIKGACFGVAGVLDVSSAAIGTAPSPSLETTIAISTRQRMSIDAADISVTSSAATP